LIVLRAMLPPAAVDPNVYEPLRFAVGWSRPKIAAAPDLTASKDNGQWRGFSRFSPLSDFSRT